MTISSTSNKVIGSGNGVTTVWPYTFKIPDVASLYVIYTDTTGVNTTLASSQYSVTGIGGAAGGNVTYPLYGSPIGAGTKLTILRTVPYTQQTSIINQGGFYPDVLEAAFDKLTMEVQQVAEKTDRALTVSSTDTSGGVPAVLELPSASSRAGKLLAFDSSGNVTSASAAGTLLLASQVEAEAGTDNGKYMSPLRTAQAVTRQSSGIRRNLYCLGDSWTYWSQNDSYGSVTGLLQTALNTTFGPLAWNVVNEGLGGTSIGINTISPPGAGGDMISRLSSRILRYSDVTLVNLQGGINDINNGRTSTQIIADIQTEIAALVAAGTPFIISTIGPFKYSTSYNATTRGYVDAVNAWIRTNYTASGRVVDLWTLFNDVTDDGKFLAVYSYDTYHPNAVGKALWANTIAAMAYVATITSNPIATSTPALTSREMFHRNNAAFKTMTLGANDGVVRALTIRPDVDPILYTVDPEHTFFAQVNDYSSGWMEHASIGGNYVLKRLAAGALTTRLLLASLVSDYSLLFSKMWIYADGIVLRLSGSTYSGGVGAAVEISVDTGTATSINAWKAGGTTPGDLSITYATLNLKVGATTKAGMDASGVLSYPACQGFATRAAATAALGASRIYLNTTNNSLDLS